MDPLYQLLLLLATVVLALLLFLFGGDADGRERAPEGAGASRDAAGASTSASQAGGKRKAADVGSDRFRIKQGRIVELREEARRRYLKLHPEFVPPGGTAVENALHGHHLQASEAALGSSKKVD